MLKYFLFQFLVVFIPVGLIGVGFFGLTSGGTHAIFETIRTVFFAALIYAAVMTLVKHYANKDEGH